MDFHSLNRRELQSLCKLNRIPANITNVAMADALKSLDTVVGIEEIFNSSGSKPVGSPRVPCTSYRTSTRKKVNKPETESVFATAGRARRQLTGDVNEFLKTPLVSGTRKNAKKETTVQRVYNTRRSARLTEKKFTESGERERGISQPVTIASFTEDVSVTSETSVGSGSRSVETSHESDLSSEHTKDNVGEECVEICDEGISKANVEDICIEFEKLDVVIVDGSDQSSVVETVECCVEDFNLKEKQNVEDEFILNEVEPYEEKKNQVDNIVPVSERTLNLCEDGDSEESMVVVIKKNDSHEAMNVSEEYAGSLLCDKVLSGESSEKVDCCGENVDLEEMHAAEDKFTMNESEVSEEKRNKGDDINPDSKGVCNPCEDGDSEENVMVADEKHDFYEALNVSVEEHLALEEHFDSLQCDKVLPAEKSEKVKFCGENVDLEEKLKVEDSFILNALETYEDKKDHVDNIIPISESTSNPFESKAFNDKLMSVNEKVEPHEAVNVSVCLAPEEHTDSLLFDKVLTEADDSNENSIFCDPENALDPLVSVSDMKDQIDSHEALNVSAEENLVTVEHSVSLLCDTLVSEADGSDADSVSCDTENASYRLVSALEMTNEVSESNSSTNDNENPSELSNLDISDNYNVAKKVTAEPEGIENISINQVTATLENPNEQEPRKDFETSEESRNLLIKEVVVDTHQETEVTIAYADDVIDHPTQPTPIKNQPLNNNSPTSTIRETSQVQDDNENIVGNVEEVIFEDVNNKNKAEDEKPLISFNDTSIRQLKKQLKALSIKTNMTTNKDDQVDDARPVLQAVRDNRLAIGKPS